MTDPSPDPDGGADAAAERPGRDAATGDAAPEHGPPATHVAPAADGGSAGMDADAAQVAAESDAYRHGTAALLPPGDPATFALAEQSPDGGKSRDDGTMEDGSLEQALRLAEALVFSSAIPVTAAALSRVLPDGSDVDAVITGLKARYAGRGVELVEAGGGIQFRTAVDLAPMLRRVIEAPRRLPRVAMETLAIVAYHQPVTRPEVEDIRGASLSQQTLDALLEAHLITPMGRRDSPGRPTLWGTTQQFLTQFGLNDIRDLPRRDDLLVEVPQPASHAGAAEKSVSADAEPQDTTQNLNRKPSLN